MIIVAIFIDIVLALLNLIPVLGWVLIWIINVPVWLMFFIWFRIKGIHFRSAKRVLTMSGGFLLEMIPILNVLPAWTLMVVLIVGSVKAQDLATKMGVPASVVQKVGKTPQTPS